ncbi:Syntaxin-10 [Entomophthora muscae]|uniref:Syntaxin-10 n=1 Tax=Entomophthora muscae TaxID=34485 RepID=A0ACC2SX00_9FUNG|nr:Syntaxin-10 [Entomophthora muscae]
MLTTNGTLDDLQDSIDMAKSQPRKFGVTSKELNIRQKFVNKARGAIKEIDSTIADPRIIKNAMAVKSSHVIEMQPLNTSNEPSQTMSAQNQLILEQQDQHLDSILGTVQNLRDIAFTVGNELDEHQE